LIKTTFPWSLVYRVTLQMQGHSMREPIVLKAINPEGPSDPGEGNREYRFYKRISAGLRTGMPHVHAVEVDESNGWYVILLEDLSTTHRIPQHHYQWTRMELRAVLHAYALLHTSSVLPSASDREWLNPRHESQLDLERIPEQVSELHRAGLWGDVPELADLIAYAHGSCQRYEGAEMALLHNDTTPPNAPLPKDLEAEPAALIDWQDAGVGMPEMDLAYIDLQPFESGRGIPREELLSCYWDLRRGITGETPSPSERAKRQLHADLLMTLWLTRAASRVALHPYPAGSYQAAHWGSLFGIVYNRLRELAREIKQSS
ncbi:MAG: phosphotransferase family protein, partial [Anaerolineales bacterium]